MKRADIACALHSVAGLRGKAQNAPPLVIEPHAVVTTLSVEIQSFPCNP